MNETQSGIRQDIQIAGKGIHINYLSSGIEALLGAAFIAGSDNLTTRAELTIHACDFASIQTAFPEPPWEKHGLHKDEIDVQRPMLYFRDDRYVGLYEPRTCLLSILDTRTDTAVWCVKSLESVPHYELSAPFRSLLHWWLGERGVQVVHASAVGDESASLLLVGRSGSGKSTTALAGFDAGMRYLGDDYVLVEDLQTPLAWPLYRTGKLFQTDFESFPRLANAVEDAHFHAGEKTVLYLGPKEGDRYLRGANIRAVLLPMVTSNRLTRLERVSSGACLAAMAPSTILQLRGSGQADFSRLGRLAVRVPAFRMHLGSERRSVQDALVELMDTIPT